MVEAFKEQEITSQTRRSELDVVPQRVQNLPRLELSVHHPDQSVLEVARSLRLSSEGGFTSSAQADLSLRMAAAVDSLHLQAGSNLSTRFARMVSGATI